MIWIIIATILIFFGIVGTIVPLLPGPPLTLIGLLIYGYVTDFANFPVWAVVLFVGLTLLTFLIDVFAPTLGAGRHKASKYGLAGAFLGAFLGTIVLGPVGIILGPFAGAFAGEYWWTQNSEKSLRVAWGTLIGLVVGTAFKLAIVFAMAGYFVYLLIQ